MFTGTLQSFTVNNTINIYGQLFLFFFFQPGHQTRSRRSHFPPPSVPLHAATAQHILVPRVCLRAESQRRICAAAAAAMRTRRPRRHRRSLHVIFDSEQEVVVGFFFREVEGVFKVPPTRARQVGRLPGRLFAFLSLSTRLCSLAAAVPPPGFVTQPFFLSFFLSFFFLLPCGRKRLRAK